MKLLEVANNLHADADQGQSQGNYLTLVYHEQHRSILRSVQS